MTAKIEKDELVVRIPINEYLSESKKSLVIASSHGNKPTTAQYKGRVVTVGLNAYVPAQ
jgi:hypothetical protein